MRLDLRKRRVGYLKRRELLFVWTKPGLFSFFELEVNGGISTVLARSPPTRSDLLRCPAML